MIQDTILEIAPKDDLELSARDTDAKLSQDERAEIVSRHQNVLACGAAMVRVVNRKLREGQQIELPGSVSGLLKEWSKKTREAAQREKDKITRGRVTAVGGNDQEKIVHYLMSAACAKTPHRAAKQLCAGVNSARRILEDADLANPRRVEQSESVVHGAVMAVAGV